MILFVVVLVAAAVALILYSERLAEREERRTIEAFNDAVEDLRWRARTVSGEQPVASAPAPEPTGADCGSADPSQPGVAAPLDLTRRRPRVRAL